MLDALDEPDARAGFGGGNLAQVLVCAPRLVRFAQCLW
jgi:hypothetical protein